MRIVYILLFLASLVWLIYNKSQKFDLKIPIVATVGVLFLNIFPKISYLLLLGSLSWLGFCLYKKTDKKFSLIATAVAFVLVLTLPSGGIQNISSATEAQEYVSKQLKIDNSDLQWSNSGRLERIVTKSGALSAYLVANVGENRYESTLFVTKNGQIYEMSVDEKSNVIYKKVK